MAEDFTVPELERLIQKADQMGNTEDVKVLLKELDALLQKTRGKDIPKVENGFVDGVKRQAGLALRNTMEGAPGLVDFATWPFRTLYAKGKQAIGLDGTLPPGLSDYMSQGADMMNLPTPQNTGERYGASATKMLVGGAPAMKALPALSPKLAAFGDDMAAQVSGMVTGSAAMQGAQDAGLPPWAQMLSGVVGGVGGAATIPRLAESASNQLKTQFNALASKTSLADQVEETMKRLGIELTDLSSVGRAKITKEIEQSILTGNPVDPEALQRLALYERLGMTPTQGRLSLDPVQVTKEKNNAKVAANQDDASMTSLNYIENRNNDRLISNINRLQGGSDDAYGAGEKVVGLLRSIDNNMKQGVDDAYDAFRNSAGRDVQFDAQALYNNIIERLAKNGSLEELPAEIKNRLNDLIKGAVEVDGRKLPISFNVDEIKNLDRMVSKALKNSETSTAAGIVREELYNVYPKGMEKPPASNATQLPGEVSNMPVPYNENLYTVKGLEARGLYEKARDTARERFQWQESAPSISYALDDAAKAEQFIEKFVISKSAGIDDLGTLMKTLSGNPESKQVIRNYVASWLKFKALNGRTQETGKFSADLYKRALAQIGDRKLSLLFEPDEIRMLKDLERASAIESFQPVGSAVNNSNSGAMMVGKVLDFLRDKPVIGKAIRQTEYDATKRSANNVSKAISPNVLTHTVDPRTQMLYQSMMHTR